jgi:hypothetical protein
MVPEKGLDSLELEEIHAAIRASAHAVEASIVFTRRRVTSRASVHQSPMAKTFWLMCTHISHSTANKIAFVYINTRILCRLVLGL